MCLICEGHWVQAKWREIHDCSFTNTPNTVVIHCWLKISRFHQFNSIFEQWRCKLAGTACHFSPLVQATKCRAISVSKVTVPKVPKTPSSPQIMNYGFCNQMITCDLKLSNGWSCQKDKHSKQ